MPNALTNRRRELIRPCECGRPVIRYVTSNGAKAAPYCRECAPAATVAN